MIDTRRYLGDGVYATFDGYQVWLETERDLGITHRIALDEGTLQSFNVYVADLRSWVKAQYPGVGTAV
jgi:hypothetical protein